MKNRNTTFLTIAVIILVATNILAIISLEQSDIDLEAYRQEIRNLKYDKDSGIQFIWNDDEESIPPDGSLIVIEQTDENKVFIGSLEANNIKVEIKGN